MSKRPAVFHDAKWAAAVLQSWANAIKQSPEGWRFALRVVIVRDKQDGTEPEPFEL